ncbi:SdpI family protein [Nocardiopsis sp. JB363]|uniref:SdpI family protein n=1 Tax=Nocardiopsis sp. JB363 TaxID=1434837 RepID=UPI000979FBB7|nr:SdpI family protein [Nocardiopsis sp. JB363]SIO87223.1 hypothetical protein BQ8420_15480 [Nocardiopsis sp. JB363]
MTSLAQAAEETIPLVPLIMVVLTMLGGALVLVLMGVYGAQRKLKPNDFFGVRTKFTRSSDAAWYAVHEACARWSILGGIAFLPAAILTPLLSDPNGQIVAILVPTTVGTALLLVGSWRGHKVARRRLAREASGRP